MRRDLLIGFLLAALALGVYWPVRNHALIFYDDPQFTTENPQIRSGLSWKTVEYAFSQPVAANWNPLTILSHALDCEWFGMNASAHHLVSALWHALNAGLLFFVLRRMMRKKRARTDQHSAEEAQTGRSGGAARAHQVIKLSSYQVIKRRLWSLVTNSPIGKQGFAESNYGLRASDDGTGENTIWPCFLVAAVFALHPLRVESVAWIAERKDLLSGFFFLMALFWYALFVERKEAIEPQINTHEHGLGRIRQGWVFYFLALLSFALGLMSKPMLVTLPFVLILIDYWPLGRFATTNFKSQISKVCGLVYEKVPFVVLTGVFCVITLYVQGSAGATQVIPGITVTDRLGNAVTSYLRYLGKLFWPTNLAVIYPHPAKHYALSEAWPGWEVILGGLLLLLVSVQCVLQLRRRPYFAVGWFWFLGTLVPVIGVVKVGEQAMADRYTYIPMIGPVLALIWWGNDIAQSARGRIDLKGLIAGSALILALACLTRHQLGYWKNTVTLFEHTISVTADNPSAQFALGVGLEVQGETNKAMVKYRVTVAIDPRYAKAYYNMGQVLRKGGDWQSAALAYEHAVKLSPSDVPTQLNLASALSHLGRTGESITHFNVALELDPNSIEGLNNLAWILSTCPDPTLRDGTRAVELAERACGLTGFKVPVFLGTLAAAYAEAGRFDEAVATAQKASALAAEVGDSETASKNQELCGLYRANRAYRTAPQ